jgi:hypothetical protein
MRALSLGEAAGTRDGPSAAALFGAACWSVTAADASRMRAGPFGPAAPSTIHGPGWTAVGFRQARREAGGAVSAMLGAAGRNLSKRIPAGTG